MRRIGVLTGVLALAACSGPALLSTADSVAGGGRGVRRSAADIAFGSHGQRLDVWQPAVGNRGAGRPATLRPVVIFWYGGGWVGGSRQGYAFAGRAFASRGFVTVVPDYRKVPAIRYPAFLEDGAEAVEWVRDHAREFGGDPDRIALVGHSAGAYTAVMLALDRRWLAAAHVPANAIGAAVGLSGPYDFYPFTAPQAVEAFRGVADGAATQPINHVHRDAPPMLLVTSDGDTVVRPRNTEALAGRLRSVGAPVTVRAYPGLSHAGVVMALSRPFRGKAPVLDDSATFLDRALAR